MESDSLTYNKRNATKIKLAKIKKFENIYFVRNQKPNPILLVKVPTGTIPTGGKFSTSTKITNMDIL